MEIDNIKKLVRKYPNDMELGERVRHYINDLEDVKYIYESSDGGQSIYRRRFNDYTDREKIVDIDEDASAEYYINNIKKRQIEEDEAKTAWEKEYGAVSEGQARRRLEYLNTELAHSDKWDGWSVKGMEEEKEWLESQLNEIQKRK